MQWANYLDVGFKYTVQEIINRAVNEPSFYTALMNVASARSGGQVSNVSLGRWLKRVQGKIVNGLALLRDGGRDGYPLWKLVKR
jgi:hypothetical protein